MKIAIIGSGLTGMTAAWNLRKQGHEVTVFEKEKEPGGLARGFREPQWQDSVECFYHHIFTGDSDILSLFKDLGVSNSVEFRSPKTVMYYRGKFYPFDSIPSAILYPGLGLGSKIRFGFVGLYLRLFSPWKEMEKVTAEEWMLKYAGEHVYRSMWEPMMLGKFGEKYAKEVNMAWLWARIHSRSTSLGTFRGGFQTFINIFSEKLIANGVEIRFESNVTQIKRQKESSITVTADGKNDDFDRVIATISPAAFSAISPDLPADYRQSLLDLKNMGAVVMVLSLKHPLSPEGYYWYNLPKSEGFPFLSLVEHTNFVPRERFGNETIIYAGDYLETDHEYFSLPKNKLLQRVLPGLKKINPNFEEDCVINSWKFSAKYAQPIPFINQSEHIPSIETPINGLYLASMSQIYPWDRGMNYAVRMGNTVARMIG
jgi:protoporphyrinogen oxidase